MTIAVVQTAFLGDVLLTLPLLAAVRMQYQTARIVLVTTPKAAEFVDGLGFADEVVAFDKRGEHSSGKGLRKLASERLSGVDIALVPHASFRTMLLVRAMKAKKVVTFHTTWTRWLPRTVVVKNPTRLHDADRQLQLLRPFAVVPTKEEVGPLRLYTDADVTSVPGPYLVLAPGTVWPTKQWPLAYVNELAQTFAQQGRRVLVVGDESVRGVVAQHENISDLAGRTTLRQAAALIARAEVVLANDSAPLHVASLQGIQVVGVFGPTVREFGFGPFGPHARIVERTDLACRPCSNHGTLECPIRTHICMRSITPKQVQTTIDELLQRTEQIPT